MLSLNLRKALLALPASLVLVCACVLMTGCGGGDENASPGRGGGRPGGGGRPSFGGGPPQRAAVPVEVASVKNRSISSYIESNGALEAETEVDIVARIAGPVTRLAAEEGQRVQRGQVLATLDQADLSAQLEVSRVALEESRLAWERAEQLHASTLISREEHERARAAFESARAQFKGNELQMSYTTIRAPFTGWIIERYVDFAQQVSTNTALFRLSDFDPLLCRIQVPERDLPILRIGQRSYLTVEAYGDQRYDASVLRISPVVDAGSGTVRVTLAVKGRGQLRPGMFANVFVETETRDNTLVIPKSALALDSVGDAVYVAADQAAARREITLGFEEGNFVEILSGLSAGEQVVVVGQDGLSDGTPIQVLVADGESALPGAGSAQAQGGGAPGGRGALPISNRSRLDLKREE